MTSDTIADMLTRIRNANTAHHRTVEVPVSRMKVEIARVLEEEGFIESFSQAGEGAHLATNGGIPVLVCP